MPQPDHIVNVSLPDEDDLDGDIKEYYAQCDDELGLEPNVIRAYKANQGKLRNFITFYKTLMLVEDVCALSKLEREMIAVVVSSANRCYYCLVAHSQALR